jgi:dihydrofolate reductase
MRRGWNIRLVGPSEPCHPERVRPLRYSINVSLDGCVDHTAGSPDEESHNHSAQTVARADAIILGRTTYELMEFWRTATDLPTWMQPFQESINAAKKYLVSSTRQPDGWNTEALTGDPVEAVRKLKEQPGDGLYVGGVTLPLALADAGLIDEYEFVVYPSLVGHGPRLFEGLAAPLELQLVGTIEFSSGVRAERYVPVGNV